MKNDIDNIKVVILIKIPNILRAITIYLYDIIHYDWNEIIIPYTEAARVKIFTI